MQHPVVVSVPKSIERRCVNRLRLAWAVLGHDDAAARVALDVRS